jgi:membrane protein DedA with SNARE-associated domain
VILSYLVAHFNYPVLFVWSLFEGEIGLALAGMLARLGHLEPNRILVIAFAGAMIGDLVVFWVGRCCGDSILERFLKDRERLDRMESWFRRWGSWLILFERFIYGTHIPFLLMLGSSRYPWWKFFLFEIPGVLLWAVTFSGFGYLFGQAFVDLLAVVQKHLSIVLLLVIFFFILRFFSQEKRSGER